jgi:hypothetical protein
VSFAPCVDKIGIRIKLACCPGVLVKCFSQVGMGKLGVGWMVLGLLSACVVGAQCGVDRAKLQ